MVGMYHVTFIAEKKRNWVINSCSTGIFEIIVVPSWFTTVIVPAVTQRNPAIAILPLAKEYVVFAAIGTGL